MFSNFSKSEIYAGFLPQSHVPFPRSLLLRKFSVGVDLGVETEDEIINVGLHSPLCWLLGLEKWRKCASSGSEFVPWGPLGITGMEVEVLWSWEGPGKPSSGHRPGLEGLLSQLLGTSTHHCPDIALITHNVWSVDICSTKLNTLSQSDFKSEIRRWHHIARRDQASHCFALPWCVCFSEVPAYWMSGFKSMWR